MKLKLALLFLISFLEIEAQNITGTIKDAQSGESIPFCYIVYLSQNKQIAATSDDNGHYKIDLTQKESDSLYVSSIGFETQYLTLNDLKKDAQIKLKRQTLLLKELTVNANRKFLVKKIGYLKYRSGFHTYSVGNRGGYAATLIPNDFTDNYCQIKKVKVRLDNRREGCQYDIRVHLFSAINDSLPDKEILDNPPIFDLQKRPRSISFEIKNQEIELPKNGVFIAIEWLQSEKCKDAKNMSPFIEVKKAPFEAKTLFLIKGKWRSSGQGKSEWLRGLDAELEIKVFEK